VLVVGHTGMGTSTAERVAGAWLVEAAAQAKQLGEIDLHVVDGKLDFVDGGQRGQLQVMAAGAERTLSELDARGQAADRPELRDFFERQRRQVADTLERYHRQLAELPAGLRASWLENKQVPLGTEIADDPEMAKLVAAHK